MEVYDIARTMRSSTLFVHGFLSPALPAARGSDLLAQRTRRLKMFLTLTMPGEGHGHATADRGPHAAARPGLAEDGLPRASAAGATSDQLVGANHAASKRCCVQRLRIEAGRARDLSVRADPGGRARAL
jgi:hypothetical protein